MWKTLFGLLILSPAYSQVFTEDIAKISHFIGENEVENFAKNPNSQGLPGGYLGSLVSQKYLDPMTNCEEEAADYRPKKVRYEVLAITEDVPKAETTVVVAKYEIQEEEHVLVKEVKKMLQSQQSNPGRIEKSFSRDAGKKIIHYVNPNTEVKLNSEIKGKNSYSVDLQKADDKPSLVDSLLKVDVVNRLDIKQIVSSDTEIKGSLEATYTTGSKNIKALEDTSFYLDKVEAKARIDQQFGGRTKSYTEVGVTGNAFEKEVRVAAGLDITVPNNAQILVFTGYRSTQKELNRGMANKAEEAEIGVQYKTKKGVKFFGRVRDGSETTPTYETGVEIPLGK
ncbi:MAG: hypothetical protein NDI69_16700 [Bacteriovoracaceae bacterium]|nr:hypothetical protein [Bacteriovoracaceae bacterium]